MSKKKKVIHKEKKGAMEIVVTKEDDEPIQMVEAADIAVRPPTPMTEEEKSQEKVAVPASGSKEVYLTDKPLTSFVEEQQHWSCFGCKDEFRKPEDLAKHIRTKHNIDPKHVLLTFRIIRLHRWIGN